MWLGEEINFLGCDDNRNKLECLLKQMMTNKVTIDLNMFCALVKDIIMSYMNSTLIITMNGSANTHILKEP